MRDGWAMKSWYLTHWAKAKLKTGNIDLDL